MIKGRSLERIFLLVTTVGLGFLFLELYSRLQKDFDTVDARLSGGTMVHLNAADPAGRLEALLRNGYYFEDRRDLALIREQVARGLTGPIDNIGELNKRAFSVRGEDAVARGGESFRRRGEAARAGLGFSGPDAGRFAQEAARPPALPATVQGGGGGGRIRVSLSDRDSGAEVAGVLVRLTRLLPSDSLSELGEGGTAGPALYGRTDGGGEVVFEGLTEAAAYEVLPMQPGYTFGGSLGTASLDGNETFSYIRQPHLIRLFSARDFNFLKREGALIVRMPEDFKKGFWTIMLIFFGGFLLLHGLISARAPGADRLLLPVLMLLTGISLITLLSLQDPLRDRFLALSTSWYLLGGMVLLGLLLLLPHRRFTPASVLYRMGGLPHNRATEGGWQWAAAAGGMLLLTIIFGSGPEGSGVKVNLLGFQPSEVVKYLLLLFLAGFFTANERFLSGYATWGRRWQFFGLALAAILGVILLFLLLGDLGPAMVVCFTFIILFSFSRGDFLFAMGAVLLYVLAVSYIEPVWLATLITAVVVAAAMKFVRKGLSESAVMALVVMAGFLLLDTLPLLDQLAAGPVQRLSDRKAIWQDAWNNEVFGGDHVANAIWAMSSGGLTGQGLGEGFAKTIPEAHTDMILPSFGEEFGWTGIISVFILFLIYLHRAILIGRRSGTPFLFYLSAGIGISTFVQFLLIAGGSTGALPLSGVSLPFVSFGGSSLIVNLAAAGFLLGLSTRTGTEVQLQYLARQQDRNLMPALIASVIGLAVLGAHVGRYLFNNEKWVVQPALVADRSGARMFSYNPRIAILMNRLEAGDLYDRQGRLLGTSRTVRLAAQRDTLLRTGLRPGTLDSLQRRRLDRYYPFGAGMFFWTGDANTNLFTGGSNGYFAEYRHAAELRGFRAPAVGRTVVASRYRESRFLPSRPLEMSVAQTDYSELSPLLLAGINSEEVAAFRRRNRNVHLALDAGLQMKLQESIARDDSLRGNRVSVVVLEDSTGDVLASAMYPLAPVQDWEQMNLTTAEQNAQDGWITTRDLGFTHATQPGSTAKILTALAAFNKLGPKAAARTFLIRTEDLIRTRGPEPDETGTIGMERAIVKSNNAYFIRLANEEALQEEMSDLYLQTGMFLRGVGGYFYHRDTANNDAVQRWRSLWRDTEFRSLARYDKSNIRRTRGLGVSGMAWGQGELIATPAAVARLGAAVANGGLLVPHRFVLRFADSVQPVRSGFVLAGDPQFSAILTRYMIAQSVNKVDDLGIQVAGKTGTPERILKGRRINDGWYLFFAPKPAGGGHVVVCVRIEGTRGSSQAVRAAGVHVVPLLREAGLMTGFGTGAEQ